VADGGERGAAVVEAIDGGDLAPLVALNNAHAVELSWLETDGLATLVRRSFRARMVDGGAGFLLAFDQDADYGSPNFLWFRERYARFVYVDRVVVNPAARGPGVG
jgi:predicted GNAT superfamily acetyltransferase